MANRKQYIDKFKCNRLFSHDNKEGGFLVFMEGWHIKVSKESIRDYSEYNIR